MDYLTAWVIMVLLLDGQSLSEESFFFSYCRAMLKISGGWYLICFMVYEYHLNILGSTDIKPRIFDNEGNEACNIRYKAGDFVEIFNNDEIVLGVVSEIMEDGCTVMPDKRLNSCRHMDFEYLFKPHYKIPVRTEIRLRKAYEHYLAHKMRNIKEIKTKK